MHHKLGGRSAQLTAAVPNYVSMRCTLDVVDNRSYI